MGIIAWIALGLIIPLADVLRRVPLHWGRPPTS